jgi:hypothetical protein
MADNPTVNGLPVAADDVGNVYHQLVLMEYGPPDAPVRVTTETPLPAIDTAGNTALASILAKLSTDPATQTTLAAVLAKLSGDPATQTTLTAVLAKLSADPATQTTLATVASRLSGASPHYDGPGIADVDLFTGTGRLMSFSARETTGSATASFYLRDGNAGTIIAIVTLAPGESIRDTFAPNGVTLTQGLRLDRLTGSTEVTAAVA